ncbi:MAG: CCA tRNA nucleotidyltransferase, partial [Candidatus Omnitrophica bacterium]|nr:CCA tRNA nucleotidyltransferase [Candidatus Omnitrophota bacterium]
GELVDPFSGFKDLRAKKVRVLHEKSFIDDPTRILRAARFMARIDLSLERQTNKLLKEAIKGKALDTIKPQRYLKELQKIHKESKHKSAIDYLKSWGAYRGEK